MVVMVCDQEEGAEERPCRTGESDVLQWDEKNPDPLMRTNMEKDRLMKYIREKCQECLLHLDEPEEQFSYFFWLIMERCCNRNGRAMMVEFSVLLFKGYGLLMRKLGYVHSLESWCLPLAKLLCSKSPRDKQREDVIMMGDDFASKGWIYPAQICYVVAQMELGLRPHFQQAGSESYSVLKKVIEKTEVYKYTESLTSGFGQSHIKEEESKELRKLCWLLEGRTEMFISRGPESQDVSLSPPEWSQDSRQFGDHATLWGLGFLYELVREDLPCCSKEEIVEGHLSSVPGVSDASKGWISPAQSFYMVAQIDLESRQHVKLVQFVRLPASKSSLKKVTEGTELHKYALSLISGFSQSQFRDFRVLHTWKLFGSELDVGNCESISTTVLTLPYVIESSMIKWITHLSENLIQPKEEEEPEELRTASEDVDLPEFHPSQHNEFDACYTVVEVLAKEWYGAVYTGVRKADGKEVGIKYLMKDPVDELITIPGLLHILPLEVALIKLVSRPPLCENVVELLDWFEMIDFYILVVERPNPCMDLRDFCKLGNGWLPEPVAQKVMQQVVRAARHCCEHGVFHCDFEQNLLINPDTLQVKLVDFGCAEVMTDELYTDFPGNPAFSPPEWIRYKKYFGFPAIIWGMGVLLFELVCGELPFGSEKEIVQGHLSFIPSLSDECCNLIQQCLNKDPEHRPTFKEILDHKWFEEGLQDTDVLVVKGAEDHPCRTGESHVLQWDEKFPSHLMRTNMEKDKLMKYIQEKCQECLLHLDEPEEQFSYFFWLIMERFCKRNGRAMMVEFSVLLFKGYSLLMRKLGYVQSLESWCLPLAKLLCSKSPRDKQREDVITLGDDFAFKGWIYPAQICYMVAQMDLGLRPHFQLTGSESYSVLKKVIEKTEVYKYTESFTSGFGQSHFKFQTGFLDPLEHRIEICIVAGFRRPMNNHIVQVTLNTIQALQDFSHHLLKSRWCRTQSIWYSGELIYVDLHV